MKCPACSSVMTEIPAGTVLVDLCATGCGGVWFDAKEIERFADAAEIDAHVLRRMKPNPKIAVEPHPRYCPRCRLEVLVQQPFGDAAPVDVELCWHCGGVWLEGSELAKVRSAALEAASASPPQPVSPSVATPVRGDRYARGLEAFSGWLRTLFGGARAAPAPRFSSGR